MSCSGRYRTNRLRKGLAKFLVVPLAAVVLATSLTLDVPGLSSLEAEPVSVPTRDLKWALSAVRVLWLLGLWRNPAIAVGGPVVAYEVCTHWDGVVFY